MATGTFWDTTNPMKPVGGPFDPDAKLDFPITVTDWLDALGSVYGSHTILTSAPLEVLDAGTYSGGIITVRIGLLADAPYTNGGKYPFTLRIVCANGQQDDRTFTLTVKST